MPFPNTVLSTIDPSGCRRRDAGMWPMRLPVFPSSNRLTIIQEKHWGFAASVQSIANYPNPSFTPTQTSNIHDYYTSPTCRRVPFPDTGPFSRDPLLPPDLSPRPSDFDGKDRSTLLAWPGQRSICKSWGLYRVESTPLHDP